MSASSAGPASARLRRAVSAFSGTISDPITMPPPLSRIAAAK
jgi:hypothetical protein